MMFRSSGLGSDLTSFTDPIPAPAPVVQRPAITMFTDPIPGVSVALPASTPAMVPMTAAELRAWVDDFMLTGFKGNPVPSPEVGELTLQFWARCGTQDFRCLQKVAATRERLAAMPRPAAPTPIDPRPASGPGSVPAGSAEPAVMPSCPFYAVSGPGGACEVSASRIWQAPNELLMGGSYPFGAAGAVAINAAVWGLLAYGVHRAMSGGR